MTELMGLNEEGIKQTIKELKGNDNYIHRVLLNELLYAVQAEQRTFEELKRSEAHSKVLREELHEGLEKQKLLVKAIDEEKGKYNAKQSQQ